MGDDKPWQRRDKCHCGNPLPCGKHTGDDGETIDRWIPGDQDDAEDQLPN